MWGTLPDVLDRVCTYHRESTAIIDGDRSLTYAQMRALRDRIAQVLVSLGVQKGERVGLLLSNCLEFIPAQHGIWAAGGVLVQMPTRNAAAGFRANLLSTDATTLVYESTFDAAISEIRADLPKLQNVIRISRDGTSAPVGVGEVHDFAQLVDAQPAVRPDVGLTVDDEAYVLFTSGSTGEPKGVVNSHFTWSHYSITAGRDIGDIGSGEVFAHGAPLTHFTQIFVMPTFLRGGTNVMLPGLDVDRLLTEIEDKKVTATAVVPTIIYLLLDHPDRGSHDLSSLRTMIYAGAPIAPERLKQALDVFGPIFVQTYAGTEPGYVSCLRKEDHRVDDEAAIARLASAGRPLVTVDVEVRDPDGRALAPGEVGEIASRQLGQMLGYLDPSRNAEALQDGWVMTGDIGRIDDDGFLYLVDRKKDMVVSGGFNVFPRQVEDVLATHPDVAQVAVFGIPDPKWGEAVHAVIVSKSGDAIAASDLKELVKSQLGGVHAPKSYDFVEALPVNPAGKIDKKSLRNPFWHDRDRRIG